MGMISSEVTEAGLVAEAGCKAHDRKLRRYLKEGKFETTADESNDCDVEPKSSNNAGSIKPITSHDYVSCCKVLLVGIGADEQLGGYGRHRTAFRRGREGKEGNVPDCSDPGLDAMTPLELELNKDLERLWKRNLGRYGSRAALCYCIVPDLIIILKG
jgi:hypothetical protein